MGTHKKSYIKNNSSPTPSQWLNQRGARGYAPQPRKIQMVGNGGPITGCLIHRGTKYRRYKDACVTISFPVLPFCKELFMMQIGLSWEFSPSVAGSTLIRGAGQQKCHYCQCSRWLLIIQNNGRPVTGIRPNCSMLLFFSASLSSGVN